ncbi:prephenate dehydratase [Hespellia stercorisuis]|uniref:Bifunctional chorismate mutase/prephenate dehydratase n=1 Tax=Hespellia stercorisuis DSM 15480 TaxID=1121950 RepID=A0A1M6HTH6_9FIRM|nr:prephenate dehydratase [Hespellia stercorisuis]SHJ25499.1 chorismate mutase / prephenate dehydratase [Hespellia stercorisuis DSM 15480]
MAALLELRDELDKIDAQIVKLYEERMKVCREVGEYKIEAGSKVFDKKREKEKITLVTSEAENELNKKGLAELFEQLMSMSRKLQYQLLTERGALGRLPFIGIDELDWSSSRIVYQGTEGAYTQEAMSKFFGKDVNSFHVPNWRDAMEAIEEGSADFAVLPIENSTAGAVDKVYDLLVEFENYIVGEITLPIRHMLAGIPGTTKESVERVYSHPQALMQSTRYLDEHPEWQQISVSNTAIAAKKMLEDNDQKKAAICSAYAAQIYGLDILEEEINDNPHNFTRFIIVTNQKVFLKDAKKISICFEVAHESGSLYHLLSHFIYNNLNMTKIESRPIEGRPWEYRFFVDFDGNMADAAVKNAVRGLREEGRNLKILGNY